MIRSGESYVIADNTGTPKDDPGFFEYAAAAGAWAADTGN